MKRLPVVLTAVALAGGCVFVSTGDDDADDFRVPLVCLPRHAKLPCARGVEQGIAYRFNLQTHCGLEWAYFDGRYWLPEVRQDAPSHWASITAGTMVLERRDIAVFEADEGGGARFVPAAVSYRPPPCA